MKSKELFNIDSFNELNRRNTFSYKVPRQSLKDSRYGIITYVCGRNSFGQSNYFEANVKKVGEDNPKYMQNAETKKQSLKDEHYLNDNKRQLSYRILTLKKSLKINDKNIRFINEKNGEKTIKKLYFDSERYLKEPFNRNLIINNISNKDDDQESTEDIKEEGAHFLMKELDYAILSKRQKESNVKNNCTHYI